VKCLGADVVQVRRAVGIEAMGDYQHMFSAFPVAVSHSDVQRMEQVVDVVERTITLPGYRDAVLAAAPAIARVPQATRGVFLGFDFHIAASGPKLIEINTNAGGALLAAAVREAQQDCCADMIERLRGSPDSACIERDIVDMFHSEWRLARGAAPLGSIAIVDDDPKGQHLYPEFRLFERLFAGTSRARIVDARSLEVTHGKLVDGEGEPVDLVYNRCTDFYFEDTSHAALAQAYSSDLAVITPHPQAHALYANKRNLALLSDRDWLERIGVPSQDIDVLVDHIPRTHVIDGAGAQWWRDRKRWFFKPVNGFGSRGSYRGDKITRRVFAEVMRGAYVAQEYAAPGELHGRVGDTMATFKVDVRNYAYAGRIQQRIARLYQGQTTNMRTPGGGFASVLQSRGS
jgi:hypothetical protein